MAVLDKDGNIIGMAIKGRRITMNFNNFTIKSQEAVQQAIQLEIVNSIKWKLNSNPEISNKVDRIKNIININHY
mgnify:CR=1 FL=1